MRLTEVFGIGEAGEAGSEAERALDAVGHRLDPAGFLELALLCIDQAGIDVRTQERVAEMLRGRIPAPTPDTASPGYMLRLAKAQQGGR